MDWRGSRLSALTQRLTGKRLCIVSIIDSPPLRFYVNTVDFLTVKYVIQFLRFFQNVPPLTIVIKSMQAWCGVTTELRSSVVGPANIPQSGESAFLECHPTDVWLFTSLGAIQLSSADFPRSPGADPSRADPSRSETRQAEQCRAGRAEPSPSTPPAATGAGSRLVPSWQLLLASIGHPPLTPDLCRVGAAAS